MVVLLFYRWSKTFIIVAMYKNLMRKQPQEAKTMQATLETQYNMSSVDEAISRCNPGIREKLTYIDIALQDQQLYLERGDEEKMMQKHREAISALDEIANQTRESLENEFLGELWERAGGQLMHTNYHFERSHCYKSAMVHYKKANNLDKYFQAFKGFCL